MDVALHSTWTLRNGQQLIGNGTYTYQRVTDRTDKTSEDYGKQLAYTPLHSGAVSMAWETRGSMPLLV